MFQTEDYLRIILNNSWIPKKLTNKITQGCVYIIQEKLPCKLHITEKLCKKYDWYYGKIFKALFQA